MQSDKSRPIRILHVVGGMNRGGIETWLMHILRKIDRDRVHMDFLVHTVQPCAYDDEIFTLGSQIIPCLYPSRPLQYAHHFKQVLQKQNPYDIVHSHVHYFSGYVLQLAHQAGVPIRIAHSHLDSTLLEAKAGPYRRLYLALMKRWITYYATLGLACSQQAAIDLFGSTWNTNPHRQILQYGINLAPFHKQVDSIATRAEFGIPADAFVVGHIGRFEPQKNHLFLLDIAAEVIQREPNSFFLLVGIGSLHSIIEQKAKQIGLANRCIFAGSRANVPQLMQGAMDAFLLPSISEGLGIVLIEAQAAGLPCIFSDTIPQEADLIQPLIQRLSLTQPAAKWAEVILAQRRMKFKIPRSNILEVLEASPFNIEIAVKQLEKLYQTQFFKEVVV
ncbi:MAG: glycosyltransferase family 1 protein [Cyanobacteria bacterium CRU_2_1]|nr:glycosyltransferase family 1 protein [Cyanobacteria bacterium CRU_2_1]